MAFQLENCVSCDVFGVHLEAGVCLLLSSDVIFDCWVKRVPVAPLDSKVFLLKLAKQFASVDVKFFVSKRHSASPPCVFSVEPGIWQEQVLGICSIKWIWV